MTDLVLWLRQQLDTDEQLALDARGAWIPLGPHPDDTRPIARLMARNAPDRVLRQVQAHRAILDHIERELADHGGDNPWWYADRLTPILRALASIYSDRDGFNSDWSA